VACSRKREDGGSGDGRDGQVQQRSGDGDTNVARRIGTAGAGVFHEGDATDGQQNDGANSNAAALRDDSVSELVQDDAAKEDDNERQAAARAGNAHVERLGEPDETQQKKERDVNTDVHAEQASGGE